MQWLGMVGGSRDLPVDEHGGRSHLRCTWLALYHKQRRRAITANLSHLSHGLRNLHPSAASLTQTQLYYPSGLSTLLHCLPPTTSMHICGVLSFSPLFSFWSLYIPFLTIYPHLPSQCLFLHSRLSPPVCFPPLSLLGPCKSPLCFTQSTRLQSADAISPISDDVIRCLT